MRSSRFSLAKSGTAAISILAVALLLTNAAGLQAQVPPHVHDFSSTTLSPDDPPGGTWFAYHHENSDYDGKAVRCEALRLSAGILLDTDRCVAPNCTLTMPYQELTMTPGAAVLKWDDFGAPGHFVKKVNGLWKNTDDSGFGDNTTTHYGGLKSGDLFERQFARKIADNGVQESVKYVIHNGRKYIVDGHHRVIASKMLGRSTVPAEKVALPYGQYKTPGDLIFSGRAGYHPEKAAMIRRRL